MSKCDWPSSSCACAMAQQAKPDPYGRVWMHCENGLSLTKASLGRLMAYVLANNIEVGEIYAFNPRFSRSLVLATLLINPKQFAEFEEATGGKLRVPPKVSLWGDEP